MFSPSVSAHLKFYVYRLIDPRNGETFYVGKGKDNRIFAHVRGELAADEDKLTAKFQRIREIRADGFDVAHVIHRHGIEDEQTAYEVEAALLDAYPGATNIVGGRDSDERGVMHSRQIIEQYEAPEATFKHRAILITVNQSVAERASVYEAVRYAWKLDPKKAANAEVVLAVKHGLIIGAFVADEWLPATTSNFADIPHAIADRPGRLGFKGHEAPESLAKLYLRHRVPDKMRKRGAANPVRYAAPE